jgi:hypothetical protein
MHEICLCACCMEMLYEGDHLADHKKFDFDGEIDYIELAHILCARIDNVEHPGYWEWDELTSVSS